MVAEHYDGEEGGYVVAGKGGKGPRIKGDSFEVAVVKELERTGWEAMRVRQAGGETVDIVAVQSCQNGYADHHWNQPHVRYVQCKVNKGQMTKAEMEALYLRARNVNATALLAYRDGKQIVYKELRDER